VSWVALGLGSNSEPEANLGSALDELLLRFRDLALSFVFRSRAAGSAGPDYLNMVAGIDTDMALPELVSLLKKIEDKHGRARSDATPALVTLDIDVLIYGDKVGNFAGVILPRPEITTAAHVLWPLAQIAPRRKHPVLKQSYADLWQAFDRSGPPLTPVPFVWHERVISKGSLC
jgi:2-amino-4-hydroxy-6-hydroxymethyldihydropteridine diphosphokinase